MVVLQQSGCLKMSKCPAYYVTPGAAILINAWAVRVVKRRRPLVFGVA